MRRPFGRLVPVAILLLAVACSEGPTAPTALTALDREFTLSPGELAQVDEAAFDVRFDGVTGDARCPADASCVLGGDATVHIAVVEGASVFPYELHTGPMRPVRHGDVAIELVRLDPYPFSAITIEPWEYRLTIRLTR
jgi:hypothetical protein